MPPSPPPKKNPLLKLAEPWPDADALKARRAEAEARPLFSTTDPLEFTLTANFNAINKDRNPESTTRYPAVLTVAGADGTPQEHRRQAERPRTLPPHGAQLQPGAAARRVPARRAWPARRSTARRR